MAFICVTNGPGTPPPAGPAWCQVSPSADHQASRPGCPGSPGWPTATNPWPAAASAVTTAGPGGAGRTDSRQLRPPSAETAANGTGGPAAGPRYASPMATTFPAVAVTLVSAALVAPAGRGSVRIRQVVPPDEVHTAGEAPATPAATKPDRAAVTASSCAPAPALGSLARAQVLRSAENQAAGSGLPPVRVLPATTYPAGPAAAAARLVPGAVSGPVPDATVQVAPPAEIKIIGWYGAPVPVWPVASQPEPPRTTLSSAPLRHEPGSRSPAGAQRPPAEASQTAGAPSAAPTATCARPAEAKALTVMSGVPAAVSADLPTCRRPPTAVSSRCGRTPAAPGPSRPFPATTTLPPGTAVSPATPRPGSAIWRQRRPRALRNANWPERVTAATAKPWLLPATSVTRIGVRRCGVSLPA